LIRPARVAFTLLTVTLVACQPTAPVAATPTPTPVRSLAVIVSAPAGAPVSGASVCAFTVAGEQERCGETTAAGTARLSLHPGTYSVHVTPRQGTRLRAAQVWAEVVDADATTAVRLDPHSTIGGTIRDEDGATVTGAGVCANPPSITDAPTCARSGAQGAYAIDVVAGTYKLDVTGPPGGKLIPQWGRGRLSSEEADIVDVRTADVTGFDMTLVKGVLLSGVVRGPSGPIEDAQVCIKTLAAPLPWECERTNKTGSYLALREPGEYYLWTVPPDNVRLVAQWYDHVLEGVSTTSITLDRDRSIDISLDPGPQFRGKVRTTDGEPVAAALVCADTRFPTSRICRPTGSDGSYQLTTRSEDYVVQVIPPASSDLITEFWSRKRFWIDADQVSLGTADRTLDLTLRKGVRITGVVRDTRDVPLEAATLNILDDAGPLVGAATDVSGTYYIIVPPGKYQIEVFAPSRGERGDLLSLEPRDITISGFTRYDVVLEDANP
jgi:carboxypeptidase family protein